MEKIYVSLDSKGKILFVSSDLDKLHAYSKKYLANKRAGNQQDERYTIQEEIKI